MTVNSKIKIISFIQYFQAVSNMTYVNIKSDQSNVTTSPKVTFSKIRTRMRKNDHENTIQESQGIL